MELDFKKPWSEELKLKLNKTDIILAADGKFFSQMVKHFLKLPIILNSNLR